MCPAVLEACLPRPLSGTGILTPHDPTGYTRLPAGCKRTSETVRVGRRLGVCEAKETKNQGQEGAGSGSGDGSGDPETSYLQTPVSQQLLEEEAGKGLDYGFVVR